MTQADDAGDPARATQRDRDRRLERDPLQIARPIGPGAAAVDRQRLTGLRHAPSDTLTETQAIADLTCERTDPDLDRERLVLVVAQVQVPVLRTHKLPGAFHDRCEQALGVEALGEQQRRLLQRVQFRAASCVVGRRIGTLTPVQDRGSRTPAVSVALEPMLSAL